MKLAALVPPHNAMHPLFTLTVLATLSVAIGVECTPINTPFNSSLVGKSFTSQSCTTKERRQSVFEVQKDVLAYYPPWDWTQAGSPSDPICREYYVFHFRKRDMLPFILHYKARTLAQLQVPDQKKAKSFSANPGNRGNNKQLGFLCYRNLYYDIYRVWGGTRNKFIATIRMFVKDLPAIRDQYLCGPLLETPQRNVPNQETRAVDIFINYFIGIGYTFFFCAQ